MTGILRKYKEEYRKLLQLGGPILVTQLSVIVFAFSDTIMVGHYSVNALAAAAFVNSLFLVPNVMMMGLASGVTPLVGALYSQRKCREAGSITRSSLQVNIVMALICTLIMGLMYFMLPYMGQAPELLPQIRSYYLVLMLMPVPMAVYNVLAQSSNGIEYTSVPMWVTVGGILLNIFGNWVLIYGKLGFPEMGLLGAGIATVFGRVVAMVAMLAAFRKLHRYRDYQGGFTARCRRGAERVKAWKTSWPLMLQSGAECVLWTVGAVVVGWFGPVQLAAYQVVNTISQLGFMVFMSFASAVAIRVAYYAGLRNEQGAGAVARAGLHVNLVLATIASLVFILFAEPLINIFINTSAEGAKGVEVIASATALILPLVVYQYFDPSHLTFCNAIRGTGQVKYLLWISVTSYIAVGIPLLMLFATGFGGGNLGAYWSFNVALLCASMMSLRYFRRIRL